ncbi:MAG: T9SS type A sorting domain-containing protein [Bacteroidia bacterium]|nr:T9SS type A sorting domain-containing protein [Bacteroidia bacterium]MCC6769517.1 T9SS type A sorting domain-containing protein [Bacteroidia bacterium]
MKLILSFVAIVCLFSGVVFSQTATLSGISKHNVKSLTSLNGMLYYFTIDSLWQSDGTPEGEQLIKSIPDWGFGASFTACNGKIFFLASDGQGFELWVSDGSAAGTYRVKDIHPTDTGVKRILAVQNNQLFFIGNDGVHGDELWLTDGTEAGTNMVKDIYSGSKNGVEGWASYAVYNDNLYFSANDSTHGEEIWVSDGTEAGTRLLKDINTGAAAYPFGFSVANGHLFFSATGNTSGKELWISDGTHDGTKLLKDINPGSEGSFPSLSVLNNRLYAMYSSTFDFDAPNTVLESDGTSAGTIVFQDSIQQLYYFNGRYYFSKISGYQAPFFKHALYASDGAESPLTLISDLTQGNSSRAITNFIAADGKFYFLINYDGPGGGANYLDNDLWVSDGTAANTHPVRHTNGEIVNVYTHHGYAWVEHNGSLYFTCSSEDSSEILGDRVYVVKGTGTGFSDAFSGKIEIFPNPSDGQIRISTPFMNAYTLQIFNTSGTLMKQEKIQNNQEVSLNELANGLYFICLRGIDHQVLRTKIVVCK